MSTDLHDQLLAAISARENLAQRMNDIGKFWSAAFLSDDLKAWMSVNGPLAVLRQTTRDRRVLARHEPQLDGMDRLICAGCDEMCHSRSGLMCDSPDAPWPCLEIRDLADACGIDLAARRPPLPEGTTP